jgi:hypothetical protein
MPRGYYSAKGKHPERAGLPIGAFTIGKSRPWAVNRKYCIKRAMGTKERRALGLPRGFRMPCMTYGTYSGVRTSKVRAKPRFPYRVKANYRVMGANPYLAYAKPLPPPPYVSSIPFLPVKGEYSNMGAKRSRSPG